MYEELISKLRKASNNVVVSQYMKRFADMLTQAADAIEALERSAGCPAWDSQKKICQIMNMPVKEDSDGG